MVWTVTVSTTKPCYDGATAVTEEALGAGSSLRPVSHLLPHQHTQTGTQTPLHRAAPWRVRAQCPARLQ